MDPFTTAILVGGLVTCAFLAVGLFPWHRNNQHALVNANPQFHNDVGSTFSANATTRMSSDVSSRLISSSNSIYDAIEERDESLSSVEETLIRQASVVDTFESDSDKEHKIAHENDWSYTEEKAVLVLEEQDDLDQSTSMGGLAAKSITNYAKKDFLEEEEEELSEGEREAKENPDANDDASENGDESIVHFEQTKTSEELNLSIEDRFSHVLEDKSSDDDDEAVIQYTGGPDPPPDPPSSGAVVIKDYNAAETNAHACGPEQRDTRVIIGEANPNKTEKEKVQESNGGGFLSQLLNQLKGLFGKNNKLE